MLGVAVGDQSIGQVIEVIVQQGIIQDTAGTANVPHHRLPGTAFILGSDDGTATLTDLGQGDLLGTGQSRQAEGQQREQQ